MYYYIYNTNFYQWQQMTTYNFFQPFLVLEMKSLTCEHHHYDSGDVCSEPGSTCWVSKEGTIIS